MEVHEQCNTAFNASCDLSLGLLHWLQHRGKQVLADALDSAVLVVGALQLLECLVEGLQRVALQEDLESIGAVLVAALAELEEQGVAVSNALCHFGGVGLQGNDLHCRLLVVLLLLRLVLLDAFGPTCASNFKRKTKNIPNSFRCFGLQACKCCMDLQGLTVLEVVCQPPNSLPVLKDLALDGKIAALEHWGFLGDHVLDVRHCHGVLGHDCEGLVRVVRNLDEDLLEDLLLLLNGFHTQRLPTTKSTNTETIISVLRSNHLLQLLIHALCLAGVRSTEP